MSQEPRQHRPMDRGHQTMKAGEQQKWKRLSGGKDVDAPDGVDDGTAAGSEPSTGGSSYGPARQ